MGKQSERPNKGETVNPQDRWVRHVERSDYWIALVGIGLILLGAGSLIAIIPLSVSDFRQPQISMLRDLLIALRFYVGWLGVAGLELLVMVAGFILIRFAFWRVQRRLSEQHDLTARHG
jgi:hypothetical protein